MFNRGSWLSGLMLAVALGCVTASTVPPARADDEADPVPAPPAQKPESDQPPVAATEQDELASGQRQVSDRFRELEKLLLRMAELTAPTDPRRAALLRQAVAQSNDRELDRRFDELIGLLREERLRSAVKSQAELREDLNKLLELLLSEDRGKRIENEKERVRAYLKRVNQIIKEQKGVQGETARDGDPRQLADRQGNLADKTGEIAKDLDDESSKRAASKSGDDEPPARDAKDDSKDSSAPGAEQDKDAKGSQGESGKKSESQDDEKRDKDPADKDGENDKPNPAKDEPPAEKSAEKSDGKPADESGKPEPDSEKGDSKPGESDQPQPGKDGKPQQGQPQQGQPQQGEGQQGEPQPSESPQNPAQKRLEQAQKRMQEAREKLEEAKRRDAGEKQVEAIKELEEAKAELEEILRQLREEEMSRTLAMLETRFRKMLDAQVEVYEGTRRLDQVDEAQRDRDDAIEAGRLGRKESQIATEADKALVVLREEGSAVAFPEAVEEMRDDMNQIARRLGEAKVGELTQGLEKDVITALEEMIASLKKAQKDMEQKSKQGQQAESGESEEPLVDTLSELRMIRALQMRVNTRTARYAELTKTEQAETPELIDSLRKLADREQKIHKVTRDIVVGRKPMKAHVLHCLAWLTLLVPTARAGSDVATTGDFGRTASWSVPAADEVRTRALDWLATRDVDEKTRGDVELLWPGSDNGANNGSDNPDHSAQGDWLDRVVATLSAGDSRAAKLVALCGQTQRPLALEATDWLAGEDVAAFERNHLRLLYGRWLVQQSLIDEAIEQLAELKVEDVADPATLLYYRAVVEHRTLARDAALASISRLLENEASIPKRFSVVARLLAADLEGLKDESLDHIARRMEDIRRRLDLGRAGPKVRGVEDGVIASLDKLIDKLEEQQQAAAAAAAAAAKKSGRGGAMPNAPLPDSRPMELKGPGEVAKRDIGDGSGWGNLPPRERDEALQQIGKDFPAHYRDVIEQYFRKLATDNSEKSDR